MFEKKCTVLTVSDLIEESRSASPDKQQIAWNQAWLETGLKLDQISGYLVLRVASFSSPYWKTRRPWGWCWFKPWGTIKGDQGDSLRDTLRLFVGNGDYPCCWCRGSGGVGWRFHNTFTSRSWCMAKSGTSEGDGLLLLLLGFIF